MAARSKRLRKHASKTVSSVATPESQQRHVVSGRKRGQDKERSVNSRLYWRRLHAFWTHLRGERPEDWWAMIPRAANESHGSALGRLFLAGEIDPAQASAGRYYAMLTAQYEKHHSLQRRTAKSPAYERAFGRDDEIARRERDGTIGAMERRQRRIKKKWQRIQDQLPTQCRLVLNRVCVEDTDPGFGELPTLKSGLQILAAPMAQGVAKIRAAHAPGARLGSFRDRGA